MAPGHPVLPHTNYSPLTIGAYLYDAGMEDGPVAVIPGSHEGRLYDQYDAQGRWTGSLSDADATTLDLGKVRHLTGPAGSITVHNCRTVHGSPPSMAADGRPLLLNAYSSADAFPYTPTRRAPGIIGMSYAARLRAGRIMTRAPCLIPPDWSGGYTSIFAAQAGEEAAAS